MMMFERVYNSIKATALLHLLLNQGKVFKQSIGHLAISTMGLKVHLSNGDRCTELYVSLFDPTNDLFVQLLQSISCFALR